MSIRPVQGVADFQRNNPDWRHSGLSDRGGYRTRGHALGLRVNHPFQTKEFSDAIHWRIGELRRGIDHLEERALLQPGVEQQMKRHLSPDMDSADANKRIPAVPLAAEQVEDALQPSAREVAAAEAARARLYGSGDAQVSFAGNPSSAAHPGTWAGSSAEGAAYAETHNVALRTSRSRPLCYGLPALLRQDTPCTASGREPEGPAPAAVEVVYLQAEDLTPLEGDASKALRVRRLLVKNSCNSHASVLEVADGV